MVFFLIRTILIALGVLGLAAAPAGASTPFVDWYQDLPLDTTADTGYAPSIAASPSADLHIVYGEATRQLLRYAHREAGVWSLSDVTALADATTATTDIALDGAGNPHVIVADPAGMSLVYLHGSSGSWITAMPLPTVTSEIPSARIVVTSDDTVHVTYLQDGTLKHLHRSGTVWSTPQTIGTADGIGDLALDGGAPAVVYSRFGIQVRYSVWAGSWSPPTTIAQATLLPGLSMDTRNGDALVAFRAADSQRVAEREGGSWGGWIIEPRVANGDPPVAVYDSEDEPLLFWRRNSEMKITSRWSFTTSDTDAFGTGAESGYDAISNPAGGAVVAFRREDGLYLGHTEVAPTIDAINHTPSPAVGGLDTRLTFQVGQATELLLDNAPAYTGMYINPDVTTTYTLTASNPFASVSEDFTVNVVPIGDFTVSVDDPILTGGESTSLHWLAEGADLVEIEPGGFSQAGPSGSVLVTPADDTTFTITATNHGTGMDSRQVSVDVVVFAQLQFTATPTAIVRGSDVTLSWNAPGADLIGIEPGGFTSTDPVGSWTVSPFDTTNYTLTATNSGFGTETRLATVSVDPLEIVSFTATPERFYLGQDVELEWEVDGTADVEILEVGSQPQQGSVLVQPNASRSYVLEGSWGATVERDTVQVELLPNPRLELSFSPTEVQRNPTGHVLVGTPFDVYVAWNGEPAGLTGYEFAVVLDPGILLVSQQTLQPGSVNIASPPEFEVVFPCFANDPYEPLLRLTLFVDDASSLEGASVSLGATGGGSFPSGPGAHFCAPPPVDAVVADPLPLDMSATPAPHASGQARILSLRPNPFNPRTEIRFEVERGAPARLAVHDIAGRRVRDLGEWAPGVHVVSWDGRDSAGGRVGSGIYLVALRSGGATDVKRAVLVK